MKDVWQEIIQGMGLKTVLVTLLSLTFLCLVVVAYVCSLQPKDIANPPNGNKSPLQKPLTRTNETNFTP